MAGSQRILGGLAVLLIVVILTGLWRRGRLRLAYTWVGYLGAVAISDSLIAAWPSIFYTWHFWVSKELLLGLLKLGLGLEIGTLAFRRFPGANRVARGLAALTLVMTAVVLVTASGAPAGSLAAMALEAHARLSHATALLLISLGMLVLWYRVPVHRLHRAILRGLATYLLVFSSALRALFDLLSPANRTWWEVLTKLDGLAYVAMLAYWAREAWRRDPDDDARGSAALEERLAWRTREEPRA